MPEKFADNFCDGASAMVDEERVTFDTVLHNIPYRDQTAIIPASKMEKYGFER